jgi:hypothetical protein
MVFSLIIVAKNVKTYNRLVRAALKFPQDALTLSPKKAE